MKNQIEELIKIAEKLKSKKVPLFSYKYEAGFKDPATIGDKVYFTEEHTDEEKKIIEHLKLAKFWIEEDEKAKENLHKPDVNWRKDTTIVDGINVYFVDNKPKP